MAEGQEPTGGSDAAEAPRTMVRRALLRFIGWSGLGVFFGFLTGLSLRMFWPRVLFEPATSFVAGFPSDYAPGVVDSSFLARHRVWIIRDLDGIYALVARCTHLGCTPVWIESRDHFKCPCHGSAFTREGIHFEGPAPRPLERAHIALGPDGRILVDTGRVFRHERGEWQQEGALLRV